MNLRKKAKELGLSVTTPVKKTKRSRRYKTDKELMNEIAQKNNAKLRQLQNMIREGNKQINNYLNKQKKLLTKQIRP
jgi:aromatic ring-opening dioxygenase LigB subunit